MSLDNYYPIVYAWYPAGCCYHYQCNNLLGAADYYARNLRQSGVAVLILKNQPSNEMPPMNIALNWGRHNGAA